MADENEFIYFLVAGLVILAVLIIAFSGIIVVDNNDPFLRNLTFREPLHIRNVSGSFLVGMDEKDAFQAFPFVIDTRNERNIISKDLGNFRVFNGLVFGEQSVKYRVITTDMDSLKLNFEVLQGNGYGSLIVKANGVEFLNDGLASGEYEIDVPATLLQNDVLIEITATSSQWRLWAPTVYDLNMQIEAKGFTDEAREFRFNLLNGFVTITEGKLNLAFDKSVGEADISVNNHLLYSGPLKGTNAIPIDDAILNIGENVVTFVPHRDSIFEGRANTVVFFTVPEESTLRVPINFTLKERERLPGIIEFDIIEVQEQGALSVKIIRKDEVLFRHFDTVDEKRYRISFGFDDAQTGVNTLEIKALDGATFLVKNLDVSV
jgi:hypothetical protein